MTEEHPLKISLKAKMNANEKLAQKVADAYGVTLDPMSAFHHRLTLLVQQVAPDLDPEQVPLTAMLEYLLNHVVGPIDDADDDRYEARLQFEIDWQEVVRTGLLKARDHGAGEKAKANGKSLILPGGSDGKLILP